MASFGLEELKQIVDLAGQELEREDRYIAGSFARNPAYSAQTPTRFPGIFYMKNEGYYQRVTARALLASYPLRVRLEEWQPEGYRIDLALYSGDRDELIALGEMKCCMDPGFEPDARKVMKDLSKLRSLAPGGCGLFLLVFTQCPTGEVEPWVAKRTQHLEVSRQQTRLYCFSTQSYFPNSTTSDFEFGVVGVLLKPKEATT